MRIESLVSQTDEEHEHVFIVRCNKTEALQFLELIDKAVIAQHESGDNHSESLFGCKAKVCVNRRKEWRARGV